ncbi:MAG: FAD-dependent oxidoreductase, partial [Mesorhizobium sp.]
HMWTWLLKMLRNCTAERYALNKSRMVPLAEYSRDTLKALRATIGISYDERAKGTLQLFRKQKQLDGTGGDVEVLKKYGVPYELLDRDGCIAAEPALAGVREKFVGGLRLPGDETGDCKMFTDKLAELCVARGVAFEYGTSIRRVVRNRNRVVQV